MMYITAKRFKTMHLPLPNGKYLRCGHKVQGYFEQHDVPTKPVCETCLRWKNRDELAEKRIDGRGRRS